jgi:hypothetical protein
MRSSGKTRVRLHIGALVGIRLPKGVVEVVGLLGERVRGLSCVVLKLVVLILLMHCPVVLQDVRIEALEVINVMILVDVMLHVVIHAVFGVVHLVETPLESLTQVMTMTTGRRVGNLNIRGVEVIRSVDGSLRSGVRLSLILTIMSISGIPHRLLVEAMESTLVMKR